MYEKTDKRRIYQLIDLYLADKIDERTFCDEFYYSYDLELDTDILTEDEEKAFYELSEVACRFSEFKEDIKKYSGVYRTKEEIKQKITETRDKLGKYFNKLKNSDDES